MRLSKIYLINILLINMWFIGYIILIAIISIILEYTLSIPSILTLTEIIDSKRTLVALKYHPLKLIIGQVVYLYMWALFPLFVVKVNNCLPKNFRQNDLILYQLQVCGKYICHWSYYLAFCFCISNYLYFKEIINISTYLILYFVQMLI